MMIALAWSQAVMTLVVVVMLANTRYCVESRRFLIVENNMLFIINDKLTIGWGKVLSFV